MFRWLVFLNEYDLMQIKATGVILVVFKYKTDFTAFTDLNGRPSCFTINMSIAHRNLITQTESACTVESN